MKTINDKLKHLSVEDNFRAEGWKYDMEVGSDPHINRRDLDDGFLNASNESRHPLMFRGVMVDGGIEVYTLSTVSYYKYRISKFFKSMFKRKDFVPRLKPANSDTYKHSNPKDY